MVNRLGAALLEGLFPNHCLLCGLRSRRPVPLCAPCARDLQPNHNCCPRCALPLPAPLPGTAAMCPPPRTCGHCLQAPPPFQRVIAPWLYCEGLAHIIQRWKFHGETRLTPLLARLWLQAADPQAVDVLLPVPLHWRRLWQRGFNQSELLCRELRALAPELAGARLDLRSVKRLRNTSPQAGAGAAQRLANMRAAFTARGHYANLRIAVVDDVMTTGATAAALGRTLQRAGAGHVEIWCLARTPMQGN